MESKSMFLNRKRIMGRMTLIMLLCMLFLFAGVMCAMAEGENEPAEYSELKSRFKVSFYSDYHCTIGPKNTITGAVDIPSKVIVKKGDGVSLPSGVDSMTYTVTEVGDFSNQTGITSISFPEGLQKIGDSAFLNCTGLTGDLVIPDSVTYLGSQAFKGCSGLTGSLTIGRGITTIKGSAFFGCGFTGNLVIPDTITAIELYAFQNCKGFTGDLNIPSSVTAIGVDAFRACTGFDGNLTIPASAATRGGRTFYGCSGFTSLAISPGVTSIAENEFYMCSGFTGPLVIPDSVTSIASGAFYGCSGFTGTLSLHSGLTVINYATFKDCTGFTGLALSPGITEIGSSAFEGCTGMRGALVLPDTVTTVQTNAFYNCGFTGDLTLPESLTYLYDSAFACPGITGTLTIPSSITNSLSQQSFNGMFQVRKIVNNSTAGIYLKYNFIRDDDEETFFVKNGTEEHLKKMTWDGYMVTIKQGTYLRNGEEWPIQPVFSDDAFILPTDLTRIEESSFENVSEMTAVDARSCSFIGPNTFKGCTNLTQIRLAGNCTIDPAAFEPDQVIYVFAPAGDSTEEFCDGYDNLIFVQEETQE